MGKQHTMRQLEQAVRAERGQKCRLQGEREGRTGVGGGGGGGAAI